MCVISGRVILAISRCSGVRDARITIREKLGWHLSMSRFSRNGRVSISSWNSSSNARFVECWVLRNRVTRHGLWLRPQISRIASLARIAGMVSGMLNTIICLLHLMRWVISDDNVLMSEAALMRVAVSVLLLESSNGISGVNLDSVDSRLVTLSLRSLTSRRT